MYVCARVEQEISEDDSTQTMPRNTLVYTSGFRDQIELYRTH